MKKNGFLSIRDYLPGVLGLMLCIPSVKAQQAMDIHSHNILPEYLEMLDKHDAGLEETFPLPHWDAASHLKFMEVADIECSLLMMPAPQPYFGDAEESRRIIRHYNEAGARLKAEYPGKFKFCASVPLPDVDVAIREAIYALDTLHADGIKLATNSRGQYLGNKELDPLMEVLNERGAVAVIHPHRPTSYSEEIIATTPLAIYEYPAETTRAVVNMISRNVLVRYPNVKVVVPHCGSFLPVAIPRMQSVHPAMLAKGLMQPIDWRGNMAQLYYDLAGGPSPEIVKMLLTITEPEHIMYGSDYPYIADKVLADNLQRMRTYLSEDAELAPYARKILWENAVRLFNK